MRLTVQLRCLAVISLSIYGAMGIGNRWTRKRDRDEEENGFDTLIKLKKQDGASMYNNDDVDGSLAAMEELMRSMQVNGEGFDMQKIIAESMDAMVEMLSDPLQRKQFDKETIEALLLQLPDEVKSSPEMEEALKLGLSAMEELDPAEYQNKVDEILDGMLEYAKGMQQLLKDPDGLEKIMMETLNALGITEADLAEAQKLLSDPKAMQEAMEALAAADSIDLKDFDIDQLAKLLGENEGLDGIFEDLMKDPEILAALNDPSTASFYEQLLNDSELLAALGKTDDTVLKTARKRA